jgi:hypothetical protein
VPLRDVQDATGHADPRTTRRYDRSRHSPDRHATYAVAAWLAEDREAVIGSRPAGPVRGEGAKTARQTAPRPVDRALSEPAIDRLGDPEPHALQRQPQPDPKRARPEGSTPSVSSA